MTRQELYKAMEHGKIILLNSTALIVGVDELARRETERKRAEIRRLEAERKRKEAETIRELSRKKLSFWQLCSEQDRKRLVLNFLPKTDDFYREYVRDHYLPDLGAMSERMVLLWFWNALPPFSINLEMADAA